MTTDQTSTSIDETVIEALRAQTRRYDVAIEDELVLSVQPNGVKTWTWVHDDPSDSHRKTLGIYPDMSLQDARRSLATEKRSYRRAAADKPEFVIRGGRIESVSPKSNLPVIVGAVVAVIAIGIIVYLLIGGQSDNPSGKLVMDQDFPFATEPTDTALQLPTVVAAPEESTRVDSDVSVADISADSSRSEQVDTVAATPAAASPARETIEEINDTAARNAGSLAGLDRQLGEARRIKSVPTADTATVDTATVDPGALEPAAAVTDAAGAGTTTGTIDTSAFVASSADTNASRNAADTGEIATSTLDTNAVDSLAQTQSAPQTDAPVPNDTPTVIGQLVENVDTGLVLDSRVARGNLTSAVNAREPVDDLGVTIVGNGEELQTYYFFTELRSLAGQRIRHRWLHRDRIVAEVPFNVGEAWRWRVYSSKDFIPPMIGQWHVQVLLEDDTVIYSLPFTYTP